jgi:hypothetical protein
MVRMAHPTDYYLNGPGQPFDRFPVSTSSCSRNPTCIDPRSLAISGRGGDLDPRFREDDNIWFAGKPASEKLWPWLQ